jgi:hypothetical protein
LDAGIEWFLMLCPSIRALAVAPAAMITATTLAAMMLFISISFVLKIPQRLDYRRDLLAAHLRRSRDIGQGGDR